MMQFGVLQFFSWPDQKGPLQEVYARALKRIQVMDERGYEAVWLAEHHFTSFSVCPSVHLMGAHVASQTKRLRIGMGVSLAAFYHPLRLAEEIAMLDMLSDGRVNWGAGRGFDPEEFKTFGIPHEESGTRFHEAVECVIAAWTQERLDWEGKHWRFQNIEVLPKPLQKPHPPVWLAAGSEGSIRWAGKHGYSILLGPHSTFAENAANYELYVQQLRSHGHADTGRTIPMARFIAIANTDAEAEEIARRGAGWLGRTYMNASKATRPDTSAQSVLMMNEERQLDRYIESVVIHGSPSKVIDQLRELQESMHLKYLMIAPLSADSFYRFTADVLPQFI